MAAAHVPTRMCLVCRSRRAKGSLLRLALDPVTGQVVRDEIQRLPGRGAYVCEKCLPGLKSGHRALKAFRGRARRGVAGDGVARHPGE
ncbi:MAG: DUF448 domain-containing protein [Syntrophobacteraceae bacterium]|nr:DUF448 domain-containing protein [Syntrophobacteraceae bacterium]